MLNFIEGSITYLFILLFIYTFSRLKVNAKKYGLLSLGVLLVTSVINYIAANRTGFFKDCNDTEQQVITDLTALSTAYDNSIYNHYNMRYDNADLDIGNNISYVMLAMNVEQKSE